MDDADAIPTYPTDEQVDEVLAEFDGDHRKAIAALLHDLAAVAADYEAAVSHGYIRKAASGLQKRA